MIRGTTPTLVYRLPFPTSMVSYLTIAYEQEGEVVFSRSSNDGGVTMTGSTVTVVLTEAETLSLRADMGLVNMQLRVVSGDRLLASFPLHDTVGRVFDDSELTKHLESVGQSVTQVFEYDVAFPDDPTVRAAVFGSVREVVGGGEAADFDEVGYGLKIVGRVLMVDAAQEVEEDNTLPVTSAAVYTTVGNINSLLETI